MDNSELGAGGVRRDWMHQTVSALQGFIGSIAVGDARPPIELRAYLWESLPRPSNEIERYVLEGLITITRREMKARAVRPARDTPSNAFVPRGALILRERFAEKWTIPRLAQELGTNRFRLTTDFHATYDMGVHEYLVRIRVAAAQERLARGEKTDSIARDVGFRSNKTLYNAYKRVTGNPLRRTVNPS